MAAIDRQRVRYSFGRHADEYDVHACVQKRVVRKCAEMLRQQSLSPGRVLDIGSGTGMLLREIASLFPYAELTGVDLAHQMCAAAFRRQPAVGEMRFVTGDAERLPFTSGAFDLVVSTSTFQWLEDLTGAFAEAYRVLKPHGCFSFALFGEGTLHELRDSYHAAWRLSGRGEENRTQRFFGSGDVESALVAAGFELCTVVTESEAENYPDVPALLRSIRSIGAGNPARIASRGLSERRIMLEMMGIYDRTYRQGDLIPATYEVVYGMCRKP